MADREGFEPSVTFLPHTLSKRAHSTTLTPALGGRDARKRMGAWQSLFCEGFFGGGNGSVLLRGMGFRRVGGMNRWLAFWTWLGICGAWAQVVPLPSEERAGEGVLELRPGSFAAVPVEGGPFFLDALNRAGAGVKMAPADAGAVIQFLSLDSLPPGHAVPGEGGYVLRITPEVANVHAATPEGRVHGLMTLVQLIEAAPKTDGGPLKIACREIVDTPRFGWRGFMLDESRHFTGVAGVKRLIDAMARYKLNRLHWHLTDSAGWRIEILKYPKLAKVGGRGTETDRRAEAPAAYYTQKQIREIVAYAKERAVVVVPEIDMPGHADAAVAAYPEHDGGGYEQKGDPRKWPRFTFNPAREETLKFLDDILAEVADLFPEAGVIHFGGDEVHFGWKKWPQLPEVKALMEREKLKDLAGVEAWFNRRMAGTIDRLGFKTGGWDEIAARGLATDKTVIWWWRHDKPQVLKEALAAGYPVILTPRRPCYFDFLQDPGHKVGRVWGGINPLADVYQFPASLGLTAEQEKGVLGLQACLWTETTVTQARRDFMTWPRLVALAEAAWTPAARKDFADFEQRLRPQIAWLKQRGIASWDPFEKTVEVTDAGAAPEYPDLPE